MSETSEAKPRQAMTVRLEMTEQSSSQTVCVVGDAPEQWAEELEAHVRAAEQLQRGRRARAVVAVPGVRDDGLARLAPRHEQGVDLLRRLEPAVDEGGEHGGIGARRRVRQVEAGHEHVDRPAQNRLPCFSTQSA